MRIVDGLEFTKELRRFEAENKVAKHVIIIGVTAAAFIIRS